MVNSILGECAARLHITIYLLCISCMRSATASLYPYKCPETLIPSKVIFSLCVSMCSRTLTLTRYVN